MYELKDNGILTEITSGNNFEYILQDNIHFANTEYKVLQSQTNGVFVPCMKMIRNGKLDLYYVTDEYRPMTSMFEGITEDIFISIVTNWIADILEVRSNGFLTCQCIDLSWDKIFVEQNTLKVKLVYLPLNVKMFDSYAEFETELRSGIVKLINRLFINNSQKIEKVISELCNATLSLENVYNNLRNTGTLSAGRQQMISNGNIRNNNMGQQQINNVQQKPADSNNMENQNVNASIKMVAMNAPGYFEIVINRDEIVIGKKQELVNAVIPFNKMISRKHCVIKRVNSNFYISDAGSANGTYVNGVRLLQGQSCQIKQGDIVRLADSSFQVT